MSLDEEPNPLEAPKPLLAPKAELNLLSKLDSAPKLEAAPNLEPKEAESVSGLLNPKPEEPVLKSLSPRCAAKESQLYKSFKPETLKRLTEGTVGSEVAVEVRATHHAAGSQG